MASKSLQTNSKLNKLRTLALLMLRLLQKESQIKSWHILQHLIAGKYSLIQIWSRPKTTSTAHSPIVPLNINQNFPGKLLPIRKMWNLNGTRMILLSIHSKCLRTRRNHWARRVVLLMRTSSESNAKTLTDSMCWLTNSVCCKMKTHAYQIYRHKQLTITTSKPNSIEMILSKFIGSTSCKTMLLTALSEIANCSNLEWV